MDHFIKAGRHGVIRLVARGALVMCTAWPFTATAGAQVTTATEGPVTALDLPASR